MFAAIAFGVVIVLVMITKLNQHVLPGTASLYQGPAETNLDLSSPDNTLYLEHAKPLIFLLILESEKKSK